MTPLIRDGMTVWSGIREGLLQGTTEAVSTSAGWGGGGETHLALTAQEALNKNASQGAPDIGGPGRQVESGECGRP